MTKDFLNLSDFTPNQLRSLLDRAIADKKLLADGKLPARLERKTLAMIFEKPSLRTRVSFESAMTQLGGHAIYLAPTDIGLGSREPVADVARVLGRMCDAICARTFSHESIEQLAANSPGPVINALSDYSHPCQAMADVMTMQEYFGGLEGRTIAFIGDGNNVARSLAIACERLGMKFVLACPAGYELEQIFLDDYANVVTVTNKPNEAVADADVVYTDTWVSMGQEDEKAERVEAFSKFQIDHELMVNAPDHAIVMHCLPAYRDYEITDGIFEKHAETIFSQAANRQHFQRTLLDVLIGSGGIE